MKLFILSEVCLLILNAISIAFWTEQICCFIQFGISLLTGLAMIVIFAKYRQKSVDKHAGLLFAAMMALLVADTFLCLMPGIFGPNMWFRFCGNTGFVVVEVLLAVYLGMTVKNNIARCLFFAAMLTLFCMMKLFTANTIDYVPITVSYAFLTINFVVAWIQYARNKGGLALIMALAMTGFVICDYAIMVRTLLPEGTAQTMAYELAWLAYTPMEVLMVLGYYRIVKSSDLVAVTSHQTESGV